MLTNFKNSSTKTIAEQSMRSHKPLGLVAEFEHAPHWREFCSPQLLTNDQKQMATELISRIALFPSLNIKLKGRRFETVSDIQRESQEHSTALRKIIFAVLLKRGKTDWIAVYVPKETILKAMTVKYKLRHNFFLLYSVRELSIHLVYA
jgi:hypothetical protein